MTEKAWDGRFAEKTDQTVEAFTSSIAIDRRLYRHDIDGSIAHCRMLARTGIISEEDAVLLTKGLEQIRDEIADGRFVFDDRLEDIHMHVESRLFDIVGNVARKLHTARSRNDQVALDARLYLREETSAQAIESLHHGREDGGARFEQGVGEVVAVGTGRLRRDDRRGDPHLLHVLARQHHVDRRVATADDADPALGQAGPAQVELVQKAQRGDDPRRLLALDAQRDALLGAEREVHGVEALLEQPVDGDLIAERDAGAQRDVVIDQRGDLAGAGGAIGQIGDACTTDADCNGLKCNTAKKACECTDAQSCANANKGASVGNMTWVCE